MVDISRHIMILRDYSWKRRKNGIKNSAEIVDLLDFEILSPILNIVVDARSCKRVDICCDRSNKNMDF